MNSIKTAILSNLFEITLKSRERFHQILEKTSKKDLLKIPDGFRNNIWWNIAHVLVTQQLLTYKMSGLQMHVSDKLVNKFKKGSVPDGTATDDEIKSVKELLIATVQKTQSDYDKGIFENFNEYTTSAKVTLRNIDDALAFNVYHEGLHLGTILSLQKKLS